jgi:hypothetical protein
VHVRIVKTVVGILGDFLLHVYLRRCTAWVCMIACNNLLTQTTMPIVRYAVLRDTFTALVRRVHLPGTSFTNLFAKEKPFFCTCKTYRTMPKSKRTQ